MLNFPIVASPKRPRLLLIILLVASTATQAQTIADPGFETGASPYLWGGSTVVSVNCRSGSYCARLLESTQWGGGYERTFTGLQPTTSYTFSGHSKTVGGSAVIGVKDHGTPQETVTYETTDYGLQEITFTTGSSSNSATCFFWNYPGSATIVYIDDLSFSGELAPISPYELIFSDEFNSEGSINLDKWRPEVGFKRNNEEQYYRAQNLSQTGGHLVITARREKFLNATYSPGSSDWRMNRQFANWTSGSIQTIDSFDFLYGKIVCRAKVTNQTGTWPAIWTVGGGQWPSTGEIDIMENYGGKILANFATAGRGQWTAAWDSSYVNVSSFPQGWVDDFHIWELEWSPEEAAIYLNGVMMNTFNPATKNNPDSYAHPGVAPFQTFAQLLWLNLAIGGNAGGDTSNLPDETVYLVDYIRVYQRQAEAPLLFLQILNPTDLSIQFDTGEGRFYSIYASSNLEAWNPLTNVRGTGQRIRYTHDNAISGAIQFYTVAPDNSPVIDPETPEH